MLLALISRQETPTAALAAVPGGAVIDTFGHASGVNICDIGAATQFAVVYATEKDKGLVRVRGWVDGAVDAWAVGLGDGSQGGGRVGYDGGCQGRRQGCGGRTRRARCNKRLAWGMLAIINEYMAGEGIPRPGDGNRLLGRLLG